MKKTVIIAIFLVYLISIVAVQFFGMPTTLPEAGDYIDKIEKGTVELTNRKEGQDEEVWHYKTDAMEMYCFYFIPCEAEGGYTTDEESLKNNPNRVKVNIDLPENQQTLPLKYVKTAPDSAAVLVTAKGTWKPDGIFLGATGELVFLNPQTTDLIVKEGKANLEAMLTVKIYASIYPLDMLKTLWGVNE
ncbi:MAG: hypothetical protein IJX87_05015 [Clostridia bacterium]|nr:hypothetical protein [Clostridia bacterium]